MRQVLWLMSDQGYDCSKFLRSNLPYAQVRNYSIQVRFHGLANFDSLHATDFGYSLAMLEMINILNFKVLRGFGRQMEGWLSG